LLSVAEPTDEQKDQTKQLQEEVDTLKAQSMIGTCFCDKTTFELIELEEAVKNDGGCWVKFVKAPSPNPANAAAAGKAAPAKGKGPATDDVKPIIGKAWLDLSALKKAGSTQCTERVFLETCATCTKDENEKYVDAEEVTQVFEADRTYVYLTLALDKPIVSIESTQPEPQPSDVLPMKQLIVWPFSKNCNDDFRKQVAIAVKALTREYYMMFQSDLEAQSKIPMSLKETNQAYEERKKEFLYELNTKGKYHILKEKMKKTIVRIVREHFQKSGTLKGLKRDSRDQFYSELYVYLVEQMRETVSEMIKNERDELHLKVAIPADQADRERDHLIQKQTGESSKARFERMAYEEEFLRQRPQAAEGYLLKIQKEKESDPQSLWPIAQFYLR
jgi:hypothetical protein